MTAKKRPAAEGGEARWVKSYRPGWEAKANNLDLHQWLRVHALAMVRMPANRHATFQPGELGRVLSRVDKTTGETEPDDNIDRAVKEAIDYGYLDPSSTTRCLVIPEQDAAYSMGDTSKPCPIHRNRKR